ncbi:GNAT family N-acetyltransferase [Crocinitomix catalasitica]|uniref:GNAT family N-acetyltransferase n=1 Tax=Crocinitomix catalasitica TaxID=184607 RepID=UPI00055D4AE2|nr:GNAT family protein [Crocinitomix catalasitica]
MLKADKIYLRTLEMSDVDHILQRENDPLNWRVSGTKVPFSKELIHAYIQSAQDLYTHQQIRFVICLNENDLPVGTIDMFEFDPFHQRAGLGILIDKAHRNKGLAAEALILIEKYALEVIGIRNLYCNILVDNVESIKLFESVGYTKIGTKKDWFNNNGYWIDELMYQKLLA